MARDAITVTSVPLNTASSFPAGTSINTANGGVITLGGKSDKLALYVTNTITNSTKVVTV
jgi:hypothetical protein